MTWVWAPNGPISFPHKETIFARPLPLCKLLHDVVCATAEVDSATCSSVKMTHCFNELGRAELLSKEPSPGSLRVAMVSTFTV